MHLPKSEDDIRSLIAILFAKLSGVGAAFYQTVQLSGAPQPQRAALDIDNFNDQNLEVPCGQFDVVDDETANRSRVRLLTLYRASNHAGDTTITVRGQESIRLDTGTAWTVTLPTAGDAWDGMRVFLKDDTGGAAANHITYQGSAGQTVESYASPGTYGATGAITANGGAVTLEYNETRNRYFIVSKV